MRLVFTAISSRCTAAETSIGEETGRGDSAVAGSVRSASIHKHIASALPQTIWRLQGLALLIHGLSCSFARAPESRKATRFVFEQRPENPVHGGAVCLSCQAAFYGLPPLANPTFYSAISAILLQLESPA
jgi:hypothetical protein